jgi:hypothetical protein
MKTKEETLNEAFDSILSLYEQVLGEMWMKSNNEAWDIKFSNYEGEDYISSKDGFVELNVEQVKSFGRNSWKYIVFEVFADDVGRNYDFLSPLPAAQKFMELQLSMKLATIK